MTAVPSGSPSLDLVEGFVWPDMVPAKVGFLPNLAHALMTAWGGPPVAHATYLRATGTTTFTVPLALPPGVELASLDVLLWGTGRVLFTTADDAVGTAFTAVGGGDATYAEWQRGAGEIDDSIGPDSGRALLMAAPYQWAWSTAYVTIAFSDVVSECGILALVVRPIHVAR